MSIRTTVTLEEDVVARLKEESKARGVAFRSLINEAIRIGLMTMNAKTPRKKLNIQPVDMGSIPGLDYSKTSALIAAGEGDDWR